MAPARGPACWLLDEPTTYLDLAHRIDVLDLVQRPHREHGQIVVMVLHDLNLPEVFSPGARIVTDPVAGTSGSPDRPPHR